MSEEAFAPTDETDERGSEDSEDWILPPASSAAPFPMDPTGFMGDDTDPDWDVWPARVAAVSSDMLAVVTGAWQLPTSAAPLAAEAASSPMVLDSDGFGAAGTSGTTNVSALRVRVRRNGSDGIAEWSGRLMTSDDLSLAGTTGANAAAGTNTVSDSPTTHHEALLADLLTTGEMLWLVHFEADEVAGTLVQRRRSPRLALRLRPVRLAPLPTTTSDGVTEEVLLEFGPVTRLSDVSATGAGVILDEPIKDGTPVALELDLPGQPTPILVHGRIIEPAVALHGDARPQPDGLPGFRRGIQFTAARTAEEQRRLAAAVEALLRRRPHAQAR